MSHITDGSEHFEFTFDSWSLSSREISGVEFELCRFNTCDVSQTVFKNCKFIDCEFNQCDASLLKVPQSTFLNVSFIECKMIGIDWTRAYWSSFNNHAELVFKNSVLNDSSFFGLTLNELYLNECKLHDVDFREGDFSKSTMTCCDFTHSLFANTNVQEVDFIGSFNFDIDLLNNKLSNAKFSRLDALSLLERLDIELFD